MGSKMAESLLAISLLLAIGCLCSASTEAFDGILRSEEIFVHIEDGRNLSVMIEPDDIVADLKAKIQDIDGTPANRIRLQLGADWLVAGKKLKSNMYNVTGGQVMTMILAEDEGYGGTRFNVQNLNGDLLEVKMPLGRPAARLMDTVARWTGIPNWQQRILCNGKQLQPERRLLSYGLLYSIEEAILNKRTTQPVSTLRLGKPLESCRSKTKILVKTLSGANITVEVDLAETATDLKRKIEANARVPMIAQHLYFNRQVVAGADYLCDHGLEDGASVYLVLSSSSVDTPEKVKILVEPGQTAPGTSNPYKAPIFREADHGAESPESEGVSIYKDVRNWMFERRQRPEEVAALFESFLPGSDAEKTQNKN